MLKPKKDKIAHLPSALQKSRKKVASSKPISLIECIFFVDLKKWTLAELTQRRPFVDTGRLVRSSRKLPRDRTPVTAPQRHLK